MNMIRLVESFNLFLAVLFTVAYFYQLVYLVIGLVKRRRWKQAEAAQYHRYAAVISARNEAGVIGELIQSLKQQNYPAHLLDIYVVADNCTDDTAQVSRRAGAIVYERFNQSKKGKGYALNFLFRTLAREGRDQYDAYFIFDADNLVDPNFVLEMNKVYDQGGYGASPATAIPGTSGPTGSPPATPSGFCGRPASSTSPGCSWAPTATCRAPAS